MRVLRVGTLDATLRLAVAYEPRGVVLQLRTGKYSIDHYMVRLQLNAGVFMARNSDPLMARRTYVMPNWIVVPT